MASTWKRAERNYFYFLFIKRNLNYVKIYLARSEETSDDRQNNNFNRERPYRDQGRCKLKISVFVFVKRVIKSLCFSFF